MPPLPADHLLIAVILRQDQSRPLAALLEDMRTNGFFEHFPPTVVRGSRPLGCGSKLREGDVSWGSGHAVQGEP
jgi:hypothetical protein